MNNTKTGRIRWKSNSYPAALNEMARRMEITTPTSPAGWSTFVNRFAAWCEASPDEAEQLLRELQTIAQGAMVADSE